MRYGTTFVALLIGAALGASEPAPQAVIVTLTGRTWACNGQTTVPLGLFGLHAVGLSPTLVEDLGVTCYRDINFIPSGGSKLYDGKRKILDPVKLGLDLYIDCQGDRFYEPLVLRNPDYATQCAALGKAYGEFWLGLAGQAKHQGAVQWWNEPYLNWAERSAGAKGSTIAQEWYDLAKAQEDGPVTIKGWDRPLTHFRWRSRWPVRYEERQDKRGKVSTVPVIGWSVPIPAGLKDGDSFKAAETRYWRNPGQEREWTIERRWYPVDPTMVSFWSGRQNLEFYCLMFGPWATALRTANPAVTILGGWDFNYSAGDWSVWSELYRPLLEQFPQLIDGLTEHHYGIPPTMVQAWYELGTGDGMALTGRWIRNWNTECQGRLDPAVYGAAANATGAQGSAGEQALWEARYNLADIIGLMARMPGKVGSRTAHNFAGNGFPHCGAAWALRLLKGLRGDLLEVATGDPGLFAAAARGVDDGAVLALCNFRPYPMTVTIPTTATGVTTHRLALLADGSGLEILTATPELQNGRLILDLESRAVIVVDLAGLVGSGKAWTRQYFSEETGLKSVGDTGLDWTIDLPAEVLAKAMRARLRFVLDGADPAAPASVTVNGAAPCALRPDLEVTDLDLPLTGFMPGVNRLHVTGAPTCRLVTASILLDGVE